MPGLRRSPGRPLAAVAVLGLLALVIPAPVAASGFDYRYPDASTTHCHSADTLQSCINAAGAGGEVEIDTNTEIVETVSITSSFTLTSASGFQGFVDKVLVNLSSGTSTVTVSNLKGISIEVLTSSGSANTVVLNRLNEMANGDAPGAEIDVSDPSTVTLESSILGSANFGEGMNVLVRNQPSSGLGHVALIGNQMSQAAHGQSGPGVWLETAGNSLTDIYNNSIFDTGAGTGLSLGAIYVETGDSPMTLNIVGNTIDKTDGDGVHVLSHEDTGHLYLEMFNNIIANASGEAVNLESLNSVPAMTLDAGYNDYYGDLGSNHLEGRSLGPNNLTVNPKFAGAATGNLKLKSSSGLLNKGIVCSNGGLAITDAAGKNRLKGKSVDIGAYERGAGAVTGIALIDDGGSHSLEGTAGNDIICGFAGSDSINGLGGNDYLDGGADVDNVIGGTGSDIILGEGGNDLLCAKDGTNGNDQLNGGSGTDTYTADTNDVKVSVETKISSC